MIGEKRIRRGRLYSTLRPHVKGSWTKGSKILFIGTDEQGKRGSQVSSYCGNIPNEFIIH
ncbi:MAG: hypothetical protein IPJ20_20920 [Flammeovirgaceae bacterium]|nr:hypothetical protein [Flammeovirgaceae bacterium]